ncbi:MAG: DMT family transporter [Alphaproteobacteria bacterium]|nr:DMT family transporter [Alphaproteobacteria bacterium]
MTLGVTALLLLGALIHATWNAFVKGARDPVAMATIIYGSQALVMLPALFFVAPLPQSLWLILVVHVVLHIVYKIAMVNMYQAGDLSQVYPVARGVTPLLVTAIAIPVAGEIPTPFDVLGVALVCAGLLSFALERSALTRAGAKPLLIASTAGIVASVYTVIDGIAVRTDEGALSFVAWIFVLDGLTMLIIARIWRGERIYTAMRDRWKTGVALGVVSTVNFCVVLWALSFSAMGAVVALRETSIVFAALIGAIFMGESFGSRRILAAAVIAGGIVCMNL